MKNIFFFFALVLAFFPRFGIAQELFWPVDGENPIERIESPFGPRMRLGETDFHRGIDIAGTTGDPVYAAQDGVVYRLYEEGDPDSPYTDGGTTIVLVHTSEQPIIFHGIEATRYYTLYQHLSAISEGLSMGDVVETGDVIGAIGATGNAHTPHLHFEMRLHTICSMWNNCNHIGVDPAINPLRYLPFTLQDRTQLRLRTHANQLRLRIRTPRTRLALNRIRVITRDVDGHILKRRTINFQTRKGIDMHSHTTMDTLRSSFMRMIPRQLGSTGNYHTLAIRFHNILTEDTKTVSVQITDAQARTLVRRTKQRHTILSL